MRTYAEIFVKIYMKMR